MMVAWQTVAYRLGVTVTRPAYVNCTVSWLMHLSRLHFFHGLQKQRETTALRHFALISDLMYKVITFQQISAPKFCVHSLSVNFKINKYGGSVIKVSFHGLDDWCDSQQGQGLYCHV
jgi:hypothetical protein